MVYENVISELSITLQHDSDDTGAPDRIRTCDLCLRRAALYPAELRVPSTPAIASEL